VTDAKYLKECTLVGDLSRKSNTVDYWWNHINAKIYRSVQHLFKGTLCDVGCNIGMMTLLAAQSVDVTHVCGVDVFVKAAPTAKKYASWMGIMDKVEFLTFNFADPDIPLADESFDGIFSFHTLEHIYPEDLDTFVGNMYRILKPSGYVLMSMPYEHNFGSNEHVSFFDECSLSILFKANGFTVSQIWLRDAFTDLPAKEPTILSGLFMKVVR
jgi:2-polyprenyl-3-methyl-5-hydroxy-6-metoxy-1,4-benzoquinol methylase